MPGGGPGPGMFAVPDGKFRQLEIHNVYVEGSGVEARRQPLLPAFIFRVFGVLQYFQQALITPDAAAIFRRAGVFAHEATRRAQGPVGYFLHDEQVLPAIAKVVQVGELIALFQLQIAQINAGLVFQVWVIIIIVQHADLPALDAEFMQVRIPPPHRDLYHLVKAVEAVVIGKLKAAPDKGAAFLKGNLDLEYL